MMHLVKTKLYVHITQDCWGNILHQEYNRQYQIFQRLDGELDVMIRPIRDATYLQTKLFYDALSKN